MRLHLLLKFSPQGKRKFRGYRVSVSLKVDKNNNILYGDDFFTISGTESLSQDIKTKLSMTKGEYPYNINMGIDYLDYLRSGDKQSLLAEITETVLKDRRVSTCDFETSISGKGLQINLTTTDNREASVELE